MTEERLIAALQWWVNRVTNYMPTPKDIMNKNQTGDIFYRLVSQTSCSIAKCLKCTSTWIYGAFQSNRTSKISTCKQCMKIPAFSHLFEVDFSETCSVYISWQVLKTAFRSLQIWKLSGGGYIPPPPPPPSALPKTYQPPCACTNWNKWL